MRLHLLHSPTTQEFTMTKTQYFVTPAPGHYGDRARVISAHSTLTAAKRSATRGYVVRVGSLRKGAEWLRSSESIYSVA
jgi:hypothetical protein